MEDGYIIGRALQDYFSVLGTPREHSLETCMELYQSIRYPRAEKVQVTSREAGDLYEMRTNEVVNLGYDEGLPIVRSMLEHRMKWIWSDDIDQAYEKARESIGFPLSSL